MPISNRETLELRANKKIYFASDFHLGAPNHAESLVREKKVVRWLEQIRHDAQTIFLVGDLFDFWFEYRQVVPRGHVRLLGKLSELADAGIEIIIFSGNHDIWMFDYFQQEIGAQVLRQATVFEVEHNAQTRSFFVAHGDGLGPGDYTYKFLKKIFESPLSHFVFGRVLHPNFSFKLGQNWALSSWKKHRRQPQPTFFGEDREFLLLYAKEIETKNHHDFYVFGHRHIQLDFEINARSRFFILGDWINHFSYAQYDGHLMQLFNFEEG